MGEHLVMVFESGVARVLPQMATSVDRDITMRGQVAGMSQSKVEPRRGVAFESEP